ncbi:hypothetical protein K435DRAFT_646626 [Dendrothele bispora CBS 962.96]|uniref:T6SS Phospholipase effector Tle1-like catalytic domain-containing protein n=1 Tax=Dendrothele bispora (strain CBS 962.96) TaxID=1314807 RepID=A0A4S8MRQ4_DENBC|nr:hypothetical protein K435DRAFT_646626 [Dendrothele bispora CBS 962.96]
MVKHSCLCNLKRKFNSASNRRLVVAFDGTENQFGPQSSHVVEFYSRIVKSGDQPSYYTSGIGTYPKPSRTKKVRIWVKNKWASITAWNFRSNLLAGYRWLSENYREGDQIFLLGFSRGAYQARVLAAMIKKVGLLRTGNNEQIPFAFAIYKDPGSSKNIYTTRAKEFKKAFCSDVNIHFVGVWDTVSSVGFFRNKQYPGAELAENICFFRHALALNERRVKFLPEYVVAKKDWFQPGDFGEPRCKEVWFRGSHSDITNVTSDAGAVSSRWMAYEAMLAGLQMTAFSKRLTLEHFIGHAPHNSMSRFYRSIEYFPLIKWSDPSVTPILGEEEEMPTWKYIRYFCSFVVLYRC